VAIDRLGLGFKMLDRFKRNGELCRFNRG